MEMICIGEIYSAPLRGITDCMKGLGCTSQAICQKVTQSGPFKCLGALRIYRAVARTARIMMVTTVHDLATCRKWSAKVRVAFACYKAC